MTERIETPTRYDLAGEPYNYYSPEATRPQIAEIRGEYVWLMDAERAVHISKFPGKFVRLVEASE